MSERQRFSLTDQETGLPKANYQVRLRAEDGWETVVTSDECGLTPWVEYPLPLSCIQPNGPSDTALRTAEQLADQLLKCLKIGYRQSVQACTD